MTKKNAALPRAGTRACIFMVRSDGKLVTTQKNSTSAALLETRGYPNIHLRPALTGERKHLHNGCSAEDAWHFK